MSQSFTQMLNRVRAFHEKHKFAENNGHDMAYRLLLTMEELGELADLLILTLGHAIAMDLDLEAAFDAKLEEVMQRPAIEGDLGVRVTNYRR